jgi:membrane-bound lytic murein transglycosylase D
LFLGVLLARFKRIFILTLAVLAGCAKTVPTPIVQVEPPSPPAPQPLPHIEQQYVEPLVAAIPRRLPKVDFNDPIDIAILEAQLRFERGEQLYKDGFLKQAKQEFDGAVDLVLDTAGTYPKDLRLRHELTDLVTRINAMELLSLRQGDGFTDQKEEHAAIDDLERVETFPALIDPKLKEEVEETVSEITHDLPIEINDRVLGFLDYYQNGRGRGAVEVGLQRAGRYQPMIEKILREEGVPLDLIYLCQAESAFEPRAVSRAQAKGMWQFISSRGKEYGLRQTWWIDERSDPEKSTRAAARHLKDLYQEFGDWYLAMAAYNSGPVRVQRALERTGADNFWTLAEKKALPKETINYVPNILALTIIGKNPEKYGFSIQAETPLETERVQVDKATDLRVIAEAIDVPVEDLRGLNSHVLRWTTPPDDTEFQLILPKGYADKFNQQIASLPSSKRVLFREHIVQKGDTVGLIAKKYGTTPSQLVQANNLGKTPVLKVGRSLIIPMSGGTPPPQLSAAKTSGPRTAATTASSTAAPTTSYTVRAGDTLGKIAARYHTTVEKLQSLNHLSSTRLAIGKRLIISQPVVTAAANSSPNAAGTKKVIHQVRQGETLDKIATTYKTSVDAILSWNESEDLSVIHPGDRITIFLGDDN